MVQRRKMLSRLCCKSFMIKDVTGCCRSVAGLLPIKLLIMRRVADVADFSSATCLRTSFEFLVSNF